MSPLPSPLRGELATLLDDRFTTAEAHLRHHAAGEGWMPPALPDAVCFPVDTDEVASVLGSCARHGVPVIAFGAGTSLEGHVNPVRGGVSLDLGRMDRILEVSDEDLDCHVEAGVRREQLDEHLRPRGLFFPVDPGADATLGGMAATGASGTTTVRYGAMRHNVLGLRVVLADGSVIHTGSRARKSSAGYDLTRLFIGSEGTLGIITELRLRLYGTPETIVAAVARYPEVEAAADTVIAAVQLGIPVARCELLDEAQMQASIRHSRLEDMEPAPTLFFEFHGADDAVAEGLRQLQELSAERGGSPMRRATRPEDRSRLWRARHDAYFAALALAPGKKGFVTDACVPISRLAGCIRDTRGDIEELGLQAPIVGHVGDGNFHLVILCDPDDEAEWERTRRLNDRLVRRAQALGGTCTGEHGVGLGKRHYLEAEHGAGVDLMRRLKRALDPDEILNPGKLLPD
ncbi:MAG: FAD-binding oxidoreductase [Acidobacteriota bacterium]